MRCEHCKRLLEHPIDIEQHNLKCAETGERAYHKFPLPPKPKED